MRVLFSTVPEETTYCKNCGSDLAFTKYDVIEKTFAKGGDYGYDEKVVQMIKCPLCHKNSVLCEFGRNY